MPYYLPPMAEGSDRGENAFCTYVSLCFGLTRFYITFFVSSIYKDIFTKFAGNVYGYKNMLVQTFDLILKKKKNGRQSPLFENH